MSLNWKEINLILGELNLPGIFLQQVYQPKHYIIIFELHRPGESFSLYFSLAPTVCRLHRVNRKFKNPKRIQRFAGFLRARLKGARIIDVCQLGEERIVKITTRKGDVKSYIWVRLWSGAANMVVTDEEGNVLDACYRRKKRNEISGGYYNPERELEDLIRSKKDNKKREVRELPGGGDFNGKVAAWYFGKEQEAEFEMLLARALGNLDAREAHYKSNLEKLEHTRKNEEGCNRNKEIGDIIMASLGTIQPGSRWLKAADFYHDNNTVEIELDPVLSARENGDRYYRKYKKAKKNLELTREKIEETRRVLVELEKTREKVRGTKDIALVRVIAGDNRGQDVKEKEKVSPGLVFRSGKFRILVGRTAKENDALLRKHVRGNDFWFHSRDYPGGYVFVKYLPGKSIPLEVMLDAGNLAVFYSRGKNSGRGDIYYTQVKYLRRAKDGKQGLVLPTQEKNLHIILDNKRIDKLKKEAG